MWSQRDLSIKGKITVIKSLTFPQILYISANLAVPEWFVPKVISMMYHFVWSAKMDKVTRVTIINKIEKGGLKMIDLESMIQAQRVMWIKRFFKQSHETGWTLFLCNNLNLRSIDLLKCDFNPEYVVATWLIFIIKCYFHGFTIKHLCAKTANIPIGLGHSI